MSTDALPGPVLLAGPAPPRLLEIAMTMVRNGLDVTLASDLALDRLEKLAQSCVALVLDPCTAIQESLRLVASLRDKLPWLPIFVLTDNTGRELAVTVLQSGGDACLNAVVDEELSELSARLNSMHRRGLLRLPSSLPQKPFYRISKRAA